MTEKTETEKVVLQLIARKFLENTKLQAQLQVVLDEVKQELRDAAGGETLTEIVEGLGQVQVKKPGSASTTTNYAFDKSKLNTLTQNQLDTFETKGVITYAPVFDLDKYLLASEFLQKVLTDKEVITISKSFKAASTAAVVATLNK